MQHIGQELYELFIEGYTRKQWGKDPSELPSSIIRRVPVRLTWDDGYFDDEFQGVPVDGYTPIGRATCSRASRVELETDYLSRVTYWDEHADRVIYTGPIDALFGYRWAARIPHPCGTSMSAWTCRTSRAASRSITVTPTCPIPASTSGSTTGPPAQPQAHTLITRAYPQAYEGDWEPFYPVADERNQDLYDAYARMAMQKGNMRLGGRLGSYRYHGHGASRRRRRYG